VLPEKTSQPLAKALVKLPIAFQHSQGRSVCFKAETMTDRRFPPPWTVKRLTVALGYAELMPALAIEIEELGKAA
jgi:hypothetical protein